MKLKTVIKNFSTKEKKLKLKYDTYLTNIWVSSQNTFEHKTADNWAKQVLSKFIIFIGASK